MKQRLLFVIDSLGVGGAEKSLITFLSVLDYQRFDVDLQLFSYGGAYEQFLPMDVQLLPPLPLVQFLQKTIKEQILSFHIKLLWARFRFFLDIRKTDIRHTDRARLYWIHFSQFIKKCDKVYDAAIAYGQNLPTLYVADKVQAKVIFAWVNVSYGPKGVNHGYFESFYSKFDHIVTVSPSAKEAFLNTYPNFQQKATIIRDMYDGKTIKRMSYVDCPIHLDETFPTIVTMARLKREQKGYDISLEACRLLRERGIRFRWYALGEGPYRGEMEQYIKEHHLEVYFILLGALSNPYPVLRQCTLYVQTSRYEGYGLSIAEARILNKPVVTTEFEAVYAQMVHGENGLVVPQDPLAVADAIERLLNDTALYQHIVDYQKQEKKSNTEEIEKFYQLVEN
jgi:glycosyltransferase involved in cell wall biosynthesis